MNVRTTSGALAGVGTALCVAELVSTVELWARGGPDDVPLFALGFAALFGAGVWLLRSRRVVAGALLVGALAAFEVVASPQWVRHGAVDRIVDAAVLAMALVGVALALATLVIRGTRRGRVGAGREVRR